jgi:hypothetical protein
VFPLKPGTKIPATHDGFKSATTDANKIRLWWSHEPTYNIGVATGAASGLVVVDVDKKSGGLTTLATLPTMATMSAVTGGSGKHFYFRHPGGQIRNKAGLFPGIDVRGDGGYVVAPGSAGYRWDEPGHELAPLPGWLLPLLQDQAPRTAPSPATVTPLVAVEGGRNHHLTRLAGKLQRQGLLNLPGLLAINEEQCSPPLSEGEVETIYRSVARYQPEVGGGDGTFTPEQLAMREFVLQSQPIIAVDDAKDVRFVDLTNGATRLFDIANVRKVLSKDEFNALMYKRAYTAELRYCPRQASVKFTDDIGLAVFNTYIPPEWLRAKFYRGEALEPELAPPPEYSQFFQHLTDGHADSQTYLLDWLATSLTARNYTILTAIGEEGIGKGTLGAIMEKLHGTHNYVKVRDQVFKGQFNAPLANKTLVYVDEVDLRTKESQDRIKDVVNDFIEIEQKGKDPRSVQNWASFYLSSNTYDAVKIGAGDRRYSIIQLTDTKLEKTPLRNHVTSLTDPANISRLARYLMGHEVRHNMFVPFRSERYEEVKEAGLAEWERYILFDYCPKNKGKTLSYRDLQSKIVAACDLKSAPGRSKLEGLAKKYPDRLTVKKTGNDWDFCIAGAPATPWSGTELKL